MLVILNLFVAVLMEEFSSFKDARHDRLKLSHFEVCYLLSLTVSLSSPFLCICLSALCLFFIYASNLC